MRQLRSNTHRSVELLTEDDEGNKRITPQSDLDYNMLVTNTAWGSDEISPQVKDSLSRQKVVTDEAGDKYLVNDNLWGKMGYFTRDFRLSNLSKKDYEKVVWWTEMVGVVGLEDMKKSTIYCFSQIAPTLEVSQSKDGWYREIMNTLTQVQRNENLEPKKTSLFGVGKK